MEQGCFETITGVETIKHNCKARMVIPMFFQKQDFKNWEQDMLLSRHKQAIPFNLKHFHEIKPNNEALTSEELSLINASFIDGGNALIFENASTALHVCKLAIARYQGLTLKSITIKTCFLKASAGQEFVIETFPELLKPITIPADHPVLIQSGSYATPSIACNLGRRILELQACSQELENQAEEQSTKQSIVILDGSLDFKTELEERFVSKFSSQNIVAVAKQSRLFTKKGFDASELLSFLAMQKGLKNWYYYPLFAKETFFKTLFASFHNAKALRIDVSFKAFKHLAKVLQFLKLQSSDIVFKGYPFGLVRAHSLAVIKHQDVMQAKAKVLNSEFYKEIIDMDLRQLLRKS